MRSPVTSLADLPPRRRVIAAGAVLVAIAVLLLVALQPVPPAPPGSGVGDLETYRQIVGRLKAGEAYYPAAHSVLIANGYGTQSVFNWRTPIWPWLQAAVSGQLVLIGIAASALALAWLRFRRLGGTDFALVAAGALCLNLCFVVADGAGAFAEFPAGLLILVSVLAYGLGWRWAGVVAGLAALFVRELAAPYLVICLVLAAREKRWSEVAALLVGLVVYGAFFAWHAGQVAAQLGPLDRAYPDSWLALGGLRFMLEASAFNGLLVALPFWVSAIVVPLAFAGLLVSREVRSIATVALYLGAFLFVGKPFNTYWGAMVTPTLMLGLPWALAAVKSLRWSSAARADAPRSGS